MNIKDTVLFHCILQQLNYCNIYAPCRAVTKYLVPNCVTQSTQILVDTVYSIVKCDVLSDTTYISVYCEVLSYTAYISV